MLLALAVGSPAVAGSGDSPAAGWIPLTLLPAIIGYALGYVVSGGADPDVEDDDDEAFLLAEQLSD